MNYTERQKFKGIEDIFQRNARFNNLLVRYLENYPELITKEMIDTLTEDGDMTAEAAIVAILTEAFGLDFDLPEDRRIIRDYLTPSVRILDTKRYTENPYYRNIKIDNVTDGSWELRWESYPAYRGFVSGDVVMRPDFYELAPLGFFDEEFFFPAVLEDGNEWMTLTPVDLDTCEEAIRAARGRVVTFGLGLGYFAYMAAEKEEVSEVVVVEKSDAVIRLFQKYILPQIPSKEKIRIVNADAFVYAEKVMPKERFNLAFVDTWRDAGDGEPMYRKMKALEHLSEGTEFLYWIENFLISRARVLRFLEIRELIDEGSPEAPETIGEAVEELKNPLGL